MEDSGKAATLRKIVLEAIKANPGKSARFIVNTIPFPADQRTRSLIPRFSELEKKGLAYSNGTVIENGRTAYCWYPVPDGHELAFKDEKCPTCGHKTRTYYAEEKIADGAVPVR